jgi:hypothetical protein
MLDNSQKLRNAHLGPVYSEVFSGKTLRMILKYIPDRMQYWKKSTETPSSEENTIAKPSEKSKIQFLPLYHKWVVLTLRTAFRPSNEVFGEYATDFEQMLTLAATLTSSEGTAKTSLLSFDMGVIPPLYFVALKCPVLRASKTSD